MRKKKILKIALSGLVFFCTSLTLTSCSEHESENKIEKVSQLEFAINRETVIVKADQAALNQAIASGAAPETVAAFQQKLTEDETTLKGYLTYLYTLEYDGFSDFPRYPDNSVNIRTK